MKTLAIAKPASLAKTKDSVKVAIFCAGIYVVMAVAQLFTYDDFVIIVQSYNLPLSQVGIAIAPALIVVCEVFSLPFLLRMTLSTAFRWLSMILGWLVAITWLFISYWGATSASNLVSNVGFLGNLVVLPPGWWSVGLFGCISVLIVWASWGLWPYQKSKLNREETK